MQPHPSWRVYVGDDVDVGGTGGTAAAAADQTNTHASPNMEEDVARLLDSAFARRARYTLQTLPARIRQQPSAAPSPVLRWLLQHSVDEGQRKKEQAGTAPGATDKPSATPASALSPTVAATSGCVSAAAAATSALARRGVGPKDPLVQRLLKKQQKTASSASAATSATSAAPSSATNATASTVISGSTTAPMSCASHWTQRPFSAMTSTSWKVFRQQLGITVELVAPAQPPTETSGASAAQPSSFVKTLPPADTLPAIRCWEEAQLPLSLGLCVTHAYALPTAVQAQCVPLALLPRPAPLVTGTNSGGVAGAATATVLGMDILAVAETGSGKTAAYLVPLLHHVLCRAPKLLGHPDRISLGPLSLVIVPTRELAEQVTASFLQLCGQAPAASMYNSGGGHISQDTIRAWETHELDVSGASGHDRASSVAAAGAARNHLSELRVVKVVGGENRDAQYAALARGAHCVVGTVGQLQVLLEDRLLSLGNTQFVVMDEADRMIDEQQEERLTAVLERCPQPRQTVMFTATLSVACAAVAKRYLAKAGYYLVRTPYRCASICQSFELVADTGASVTGTAEGPVPAASGAATATAEGRQKKPSRQQGHTEKGEPQPPQRQRLLHPLIHAQKFVRLVAWLVYGTGPIIVFANEKSTCDALWEELRAEAEHLDAQQEYYTIEDIVGPPPDGLSFREDTAVGQGATSSSVAARRTPTLANLTSVAVVHSELSQTERRSLVAQFQRRQRHVLITTDLLARGLDVAGVTLVINYDVPWAASASPSDAVTLYIHRIGRTGRAGSTGVAVTFVTLPAAMVQRAEEVAREEARDAAPKPPEGRTKPPSAAPRVYGDEDDDLAALGELFDGDTRNVCMAGAAALSTTAADNASGRRRRRGDDDSDDTEVDSSNDSDDDNDDEDTKKEGATGNTSNTANHNGNGMRKPPRKRRKRSVATFASDVAVLRPLWSFLVECAEGEGCRDGAAALRRGTYAKISVPAALGCIMAQLSATSQYGRITL
ncbi:putative ATP-dependent RNA helicase [Leishmania infantum JPCM5]|uniref:RNA helicase n=2 Tax=Leishmania infantum TaxID=5671 RepID=A4HSI1_LEIIN|nr:putative ATP-dependent RNA helicase [Leishmania infantum JPCM5]CAC9443513.1 ATP-dependent_RNA_helicase_-_putative [Leishmania infantum]CAM65369.1 putative ATP-dependent RNA helicase [Leishmania infantum JPCM5]SUZ38980.1 ATP-dependent_RNA_helicase_-_putative [Leishmania infantum]|eukprot:XP_001463022.1 putative ATP-dependent RNA helicase [Leishmania infantum JPCM5]